MVAMTVGQMKRAGLSKDAIDQHAGDRWIGREEYPMPLPPHHSAESHTAYLRRIARRYPDQYPAAFRTYGASAASEGWWTRTFG